MKTKQKLKDHCVIVTGASQGFGFAAAKAFVEAGAHVVLCARSPDALYNAQKELQQLVASTGGHTKVLAMPADISKPAEVEALIQYALKEVGHIDTLVANAGIYGPKGAIDELDWDAWSEAIDINLKGTVFLCRAVLPHFKQKRAGKIILLSGGGATKPMPFLSAYATSKAAVVRFGETLAEEVQSFNIDVNAIAPGALNTRLLEEILEAGPDKVGAAFYEQSLKQKQQGGAPLEVGSALCVYLASPESNGITGRLISAVWDPWETLHEHEAELQSSDIYTLRRIVPRDRGQEWGDK